MVNKDLVLVVEDDADWVEILRNLLEDAGFMCLISHNFIDAIKTLKTTSPLALIVDLRLGDSSYNETGWGGWPLASEAKKYGISSIIITGYPKYSRASRAFRDFNVIDFFSKKDFPDVKTTFVKRVQEAVDDTKKRQRRKFKKAVSREKVRNTYDEKGNSVFISYSHKDRKWLDRFKTNLTVLERTNGLSIWDDTKIQAGSKWKHEIDIALSSAKVALLLVTPDFLVSDFINNTELPFLFKSAKKKGLHILWVAVKPSMYEETYIAEFQSVNDPSKPLASLSRAKAEQEIIQICKKVKEAAQ